MTKKTTTKTFCLVLIETTTEVIETTGEESKSPAVLKGPGLAKCLPVRQSLRLAGGSR